MTAVIGDTPHDMTTTVDVPAKWVVATINGDGFKDEITVNFVVGGSHISPPRCPSGHGMMSGGVCVAASQ